MADGEPDIFYPQMNGYHHQYGYGWVRDGYYITPAFEDVERAILERKP